MPFTTETRLLQFARSPRIPAAVAFWRKCDRDGARPPRWFQGPRDLLTRVADPRQDGPARALQRGLGESIPTAVYLFARCARSRRNRLRARSRERTVAREPRHLASRGSPQSLGARRARIATTDRT